jgi:hypothetical protein
MTKKEIENLKNIIIITFLISGAIILYGLASIFHNFPY